MKKFFIASSILLCFSSVFSQVKSPEAFLGYPLGSKYTPHYRIVQYFQHVAQQIPDKVKLEQYGETYEGRPLFITTVTSQENLSKIEGIRENNLRLANNISGEKQANENSPAIVWLSYNVHGNETSSSEAAMLTLFELVNQSNTQAAEWLKNTVVIIDPCLNPDGRDRYINWYNSVIGNHVNLQRQAREHHEPWPGGRSNHYYFDLNRDWAWQTQVETRSRIAKYNQWLPQVHVDFHEQGINEPYYFAPAAEPFHDVISSWQREFQTEIGKNHARYFDKNGWLYFTKERFDLFYPSYGDTYPTFSGSVGMTYEQGGIRAGLGIINEEGDTLTLRDRILHHFTTGISTVEVTSKNAAKVVHEFRSYFKNSIESPKGEFRSWLIKNDSTDRISRLKSLLERNGIDWYYAKAANLSGINYFTGKQEAVKAATGDIVININQPRGNLIKVLFERNSRLSDSATYDITAWSIPFVYGLKTYGIPALTTALSKTAPAETSTVLPDNLYAYAIKWDGLNSARFLSFLLKRGIRVRYAEQPFKSGTQSFEKGSLLITQASNAGKPLKQILEDASKTCAVTIYPVVSGMVERGYDLGSDRVRVINAPNVALVYGDPVSSLGLGEIWHLMEQELDYPVTLISANDFFQDGMKQFNVLILAEGYYDFLNRKETNEDLKNWVKRGGKIIAIGESVAQFAKADWGIKIREDEKKEGNEKIDYSDLKKYENRERDALVNSNPGSIYKLELDQSHPLGFGYPDFYFSLKLDNHIYEFLKEGGWNVGVIKKDNYVSGFTGSQLKEKLKDALSIGVQDLGNGQVIYFADDPIFRSFWENGKLLFCNAVFLVGQ